MKEKWEKYLNKGRFRSSVDGVRTMLSDLDARNAFESDFVMLAIVKVYRQ